jgi:hypothetical protein
MHTRPDDASLDQAWTDLFADYPATFAVTVAYNPGMIGTILPTHRIIMETGERIRLPMPTLRARSGLWQLATHRKIPCERVHAHLHRLHRDVDRKLFGSRFNKLSSKRRTEFIGFIQHEETNIHVHLSWGVPDNRCDEFGELIGPLWRKMVPHGTTDLKRIYNKGWGSYTTRERPALKAPELFVASRA